MWKNLDTGITEKIKNKVKEKVEKVEKQRRKKSVTKKVN